MRVDFEAMHAAGWSPLDSANRAEASGMARLEVYKAIFDHWGPTSFAVDELLHQAAGYPSRAAQAAATVGLAAIVLEYSTVTLADFAAFERTTRISRKVVALARADRPDDALRFYDRLHATELRLEPITEAEARHVVLEMRATSSALSSVVVDNVERHPWGWLFTPNLDDDRAGRIPAPPGAGVRPILFDRFTGLAIGLHRVESAPVYLQRYEETGWPFVQ